MAARKKDIAAAAVIIAFYLMLECFGITCPIKFLTGISCAGCGMSRAWLSLLRGDPAAAFYYHPLFWLPVPVLAVLLCRAHMPRALYRALLTLAAAAMLLVWLWRLIFVHGDIVVFEPLQCLPLRILRFAAERIARLSSVH